MPLTKQYLSYQAECCYGVVAGRKGGALLTRGDGGRLTSLSPALEKVLLWDLRTGTVVGELSGVSQVEVGVVCLSGDGHILAVGLEDGSVVLWDMLTRTIRVTLRGHRSAVTCLKFNADHTQLVSGAKDTHVVVWDTVSETGLFRLKGHKGQVTECEFLSQDVLITSSKDGLVKLWDLHTQHCFQTLVSHHREVWSFEIVGGACDDMVRLVVASGDPELKVYHISHDATQQSNIPVVAVEVGSLKNSSSGNVTYVKTDPTHQYLATLCQQHAGVDIYHVCSANELEMLLKKRRKKASKKNPEDMENISLSVKDEFKLVCSVHGEGKLRAVDLLTRTSEELLVLLTMHNNSVALYSVVDGCSQQLYTVTTPGHRTDVRTLSFSSDNSRILSASAKLVKIWNRSTQQCVCTMTSRYALCSTFVPGDRYAIIGTKTGHLQLFEVSSSFLLEEIPAHEGAVWGMATFADKRGVVTASADHTVKFWEFDLVSRDGEPHPGKKLTLTPTRTLKLSDDVLAVCCSVNGRLLAVALLDSTIKVFFNDTLKFFLSLYGHKLPVLSMDISSDSTLIVSCSADKNIRIWGLDFGDCHKSIFAHDDSVMVVRFIPDTHLLFSTSKDNTIKCWDADSFQHVQTLKGHHGEVWCLAISSDGDTLVSGSHDMSIRLWQRTLEPLILSEQKELERESFMDQLSARDDNTQHVIPGEVPGEASLPLTNSKETIPMVDRLLESLAIWKEEQVKMVQYKRLCATASKEVAPPQPHPMLLAKGDIQAERYVLDVVKGIKSNELEECLLVMPYDQMMVLLQLADVWLERGWEVELTCRCLFFLLRVHHLQLTRSQSILPILHSLSTHTSTQVTDLKDLYGLNLAGLQFLKRELEHQGTTLFDDAPTLVRKKRKMASKTK